MKIVLVYPQPIPLVTKHDRGSVSGLGLMYLATAVGDEHDVTILGGTENPICTSDLIEQITQLQPDVLGISTIYSTLMISGKEIAKEIKKRFPKTVIIFGGNHAMFIADQLATEEYVDIIVIGEGEITFKELIEKLDDNRSIEDTNGIVFRKNGRVHRTQPRPAIMDIDSIAFPNWKLLTNELPVSIDMCSSRGCPHSCIYCSTTSFWGRKWRRRSARNIVDELHFILDTFSPEKKKLTVSFVDDNFTVDKKRVLEFCRLVMEENLELEWGASSRVESLDAELLAALSDSGCTGLFLGIESGSARVLKAMNRNYTPDLVAEKVELCLEYGILPTCSFIVGNPFEDKSDVEQTFALLKRLKSHKLQVHIFTPLIGTEVFRNPEKFGIELLPGDHATMHLEAKARLNTAHFSASEINDFYLKGMGLICKRLREGKRLMARAEWNRKQRGNVEKDTG